MKIIKRIIQHFCDHKYTKTWNREKNGYVYECVKCGKQRDEP